MDYGYPAYPVNLAGPLILPLDALKEADLIPTVPPDHHRQSHEARAEAARMARLEQQMQKQEEEAAREAAVEAALSRQRWLIGLAVGVPLAVFLLWGKR
jgi:hypothetical protein